MPARKPRNKFVKVIILDHCFDFYIILRIDSHSVISFAKMIKLSSQEQIFTGLC